MNRRLKVLAILIFLLSVGTLFFSSQVIMRLKEAKEKIEEMSSTIQELEGKNTQLTQEVTSLTQTKNYLEETLARVRREKERYRSALEREKEYSQRLEGELEKAKSKNESLEREVSSLNSRLRLLKTQVETLEEEKKKIILTLEEEKKRRKELENELAKYKGKKIPEEKREVKLKPEVEKGVVGELVEFREPGLVVVKFSQDRIPSKGAVLYAFRGGKIVGKLTVREIYNTVVVARTDFESLDTRLKRGDILIITKWVPAK